MYFTSSELINRTLTLRWFHEQKQNSIDYAFNAGLYSMLLEIENLNFYWQDIEENVSQFGHIELILHLFSCTREYI